MTCAHCQQKTQLFRICIRCDYVRCLPSCSGYLLRNDNRCEGCLEEYHPYFYIDSYTIRNDEVIVNCEKVLETIEKVQDQMNDVIEQLHNEVVAIRTAALKSVNLSGIYEWIQARQLPFCKDCGLDLKDISHEDCREK